MLLLENRPLISNGKSIFFPGILCRYPWGLPLFSVDDFSTSIKQTHKSLLSTHCADLCFASCFPWLMCKQPETSLTILQLGLKLADDRKSPAEGRSVMKSLAAGARDAF